MHKILSTFCACSLLSCGVQAQSFDAPAHAPQSQLSIFEDDLECDPDLQDPPPGGRTISLRTFDEVQWLSVDISKGVMLVNVEIEGREATALIDNGADVSVVDLGFARDIGLPISCSSRLIDALFSQAEVRYVGELDILIPHQVSINTMIDATDLSGLSNAAGRDIDLIIGAEVFDYLALAYDRRRQGVVFRQPNGLTVSWPDAIEYTLSDGVFVAEINGRNTSLAIDLGSNIELSIASRSSHLLADRPPDSVTNTVDGAGASNANATYLNVPFKYQDFETELTAIVTPQVFGGADGRVGFTLFLNEVVIFDLGNDRILVGRQQ